MTAQPLAPWIGGKHLLKKRLTAIIDATPHDTYVEPFVGMAGVFFARRVRPTGEIINDLNAEIPNLFRVVRDDADALMARLRWQLSCEADYRALLATPPAMLVPVDRAARFLFLQSLAAAGNKATPDRFRFSMIRAALFQPARALDRIARARDRLDKVTILCRDALRCIDNCDRPNTLFYLDPPYAGYERMYGDGWHADRLAAMADALRGIEGKFLLSLNDTPETRALFDWAVQRAVTVRWSAGSKNLKKTELIVANFAFEVPET